tara:strand:- start:300 stop:608 length:309 start_codon:yes stop_codon:yes gene_type:complete
MSGQFLDQFTLLHFAVGIVVYFWGMSLPVWMGIHTCYEIFEVTPFGVYFINTYFGKLWPGEGKSLEEPTINAIGDTIGAFLGWTLAYYVAKLGKKYNWYRRE